MLVLKALVVVSAVPYSAGTYCAVVNRGYCSNTDGVIDGRIRSGFVKDIDDRELFDIVTKKLLG